MNHHRGRLLAVRPDIESAEPAGQVEIDLRRAALPFAPDRVAQGVFEFWAIKRAFAGIDGGLGVASFERLEDTDKAASARSQALAEPTRFSGRVDNLMTMSNRNPGRWKMSR
jgi:hypothetical protein